jgi:hypothetical protein
MRQDFRFKFESPEEVRNFLRSLSDIAKIDDRSEFFVFAERSGESFSFDCELLPFGLRTNRSGSYFKFLGQFLEQLTGEFGAVEVEDS